MGYGNERGSHYHGDSAAWERETIVAWERVSFRVAFCPLSSHRCRVSNNDLAGQLIRLLRLIRNPRNRRPFLSVRPVARRTQTSLLRRSSTMDYQTMHRALVCWKPYSGLIYFHLLLDRLERQVWCPDNDHNSADTVVSLLVLKTRSGSYISLNDPSECRHPFLCPSDRLRKGETAHWQCGAIRGMEKSS